MNKANIILADDAAMPKYRLLADAVKNAIAEGRLTAGDALPSVSYVCESFDLSRDTVFKAYSLLREQGVVISHQGKGYYISDSVLRVFVFLDTFKAYKEVLYDSFFHNLPKNVIVDVNFHHYNPKLFKKLIEDSVGRYSKYIIMPFVSDDAEKLLKKIPQERLLVIDWNLYTNSSSNVVYQDFGDSLYRGLEEVRERISRYRSFHFLYPEFTYHPYQSVQSFERFCRTYNIDYVVERDPAALKVEKGVAYLSVSDRMLGRVLEQCREKHLTIGEGVGIISYNETPMKQFIDNGITVFSTDFALMGRLAAKFVTEESHTNELVPSRMLIRNSL